MGATLFAIALIILFVLAVLGLQYLIFAVLYWLVIQFGLLTGLYAMTWSWWIPLIIWGIWLIIKQLFFPKKKKSFEEMSEYEQKRELRKMFKKLIEQNKYK